MKGKFIVFEGIDGAGKTTQINLLTRFLQESGKLVYRTAEPTDSSIGKLLRNALAGKEKKTSCEMATMFLLDRISHNVNPENGIQKMLEEGYYVICDRYYYSSIAYQGSETDEAWVSGMNLNCPEILHPDVCIFLDLTPEESMERILKRNESLEIYENTERLKKVRDKFFDTFARMKNENIQVVHANGTPEEVHREILSLIKI